MNIVVGSDHAGRTLRAEVAVYLKSLGHTVIDVGTEGPASVDYPEYAQKACAEITAGRAERGIVICGTGVGVSMAANRIPGIRAALCTNEFTATMARVHNDAQVLCMGERVVGIGLALAMVKTFIETAFEGGRHARRVEQLTAMEQK